MTYAPVEKRECSKRRWLAWSVLIPLLAIGLVDFATPVSCALSPRIVLQDNFNDGILDIEKWRTNTTVANSSVIERYPECDLESKNRGYLNSKFQWKPGALGIGTLSVKGRFRLRNEGAEEGDIAQICVRSCGQPRDPTLVKCPMSHCKDCIEVGVTRLSIPDYGCIMWIDLHVGPDQDFTLAYKSFSVGSDWYWFKVEDNGYNIRVWCNPTGDFSGNPDLEAVSGYSFAINRVSFYGMMYLYDLDHTTYFDDITITIGPAAVGGVWVPVDKLGLLTPYIGVASAIIVATAATAILVKRGKSRKERQ